jgi:hypothetical protein
MSIVAAGVLLGCFGPVTPAAAHPPDPDNAALLYYQAFLLVPQTEDRALTDLVANVANGAAVPNDQVKEYLKKCQAALDSAVAAAELTHCDWGLRYSKGFSAQMPYLAQVRSLSRLILADARIQAAEGKYRPALERCLTAYKLAGHTGNEVLISFLVSVAIGAQANKGVTDILGRMPAEVETLTWLKGRLATVSAGTLTADKAMVLEREVALETMRPERMADLAGILAEPSGMSAEEIRKGLNEQVLQRAREYSSNFMDSVLAVLRGRTPYVESYTKLKELADRLNQDAAKDPAVKLIGALAPAVTKIYVLQVRHQADVNALQAAVDVYLAKAATGRLPQSLPAAAPRDPYTGNMFRYEPTAEGFVLCCGAKDLDKNEVREYQFVIPK